MDEKPERRQLTFSTLGEAVADAERLASGKVRTTGNHSFGQILEHLARTHDMATGKIEAPRPPWFVRLMMPLMKSFILKDVKPGYKLPPESEAFFWPDKEFDVREALMHLKESVANYESVGPLEKHPVFGRVSRQQNLELNCKR